MALFYNIIDVAVLSAYRVYELAFPTWMENRNDKRKVFIRELCMDLAKNHLKKRANGNLRENSKIALKLIGIRISESNDTREVMAPIVENNVKKRCVTCTKLKKDNKTTAVCDLCSLPTCTKHYLRSCETYFLKNRNEIDDEEDELPNTSAASRRKRPPSPI